MSTGVKFTTTREDLALGMAAVLHVIPRRPTLPALSCVLIETDGDAVVLSATDLDVQLRIRVPATIERGGKLLVSAATLDAMVKELPSAGIRISAKGKRAMALECGRTSTQLVGLDPEEFAVLQECTYTGDWFLPAKTLTSMTARVAFAASTEESRPILNGVLCRFLGPSLEMVATNGHVLSQAIASAGSGSLKAGDLIVPPRFLALMSLFAPDDDVAFGRTEYLIAARTTSIEIMSRVIEGPYPDYEAVLPKEINKRLTVDRANLVMAIRRCMVTATKESPRIRWDIGANRIKMSSATPDMGRTAEEVSCEYEGDPIVIGFNGAYLLKMLKRLTTDDVAIGLLATETATEWREVDSDHAGSVKMVCMPLRLLDEGAPFRLDGE